MKTFLEFLFYVFKTLFSKKQKPIKQFQHEVEKKEHFTETKKIFKIQTKRNKVIKYLTDTENGLTKSEAKSLFDLERLDTLVCDLKKIGFIFETKKEGKHVRYFLIAIPG